MRTLLTALTALMLFATPVVAGDQEKFQDALIAYQAGNYPKAIRLYKPLAERGYVSAQHNPSVTVDTLHVSRSHRQVQLVQLQTNSQVEVTTNDPVNKRWGEPIGRVDNVEGMAFIVRLDDVTIPAVSEMEVFLGDTVKTTDNSIVSVIFVDETRFALGEKGQMVIDELSYSPTYNKGSSIFSVIEGVFSFVSGKIAKTGPESVLVKMPVVTIGIRGTKVAGRAAIEGSENSVTLLPEEDGSVGEISVQNSAGIQILNQPFQTTKSTSVSRAPTLPEIISKGAVERLYGTVSQVVSPRATTGTKIQRDNARGSNVGKAADLDEEQAKKFDQNKEDSNNKSEEQNENIEPLEEEELEKGDEAQGQSEESGPSQGVGEDLKGEAQEEADATTDGEMDSERGTEVSPEQGEEKWKNNGKETTKTKDTQIQSDKSNDASSNQLFEYICSYDSLCDGGDPNWKGWGVLVGVILLFCGFIIIFVLLLP